MIIGFLFLLFSSTHSWALIETRLSWGKSNGSPVDINSVSDAPSLSKVAGFGLDGSIQILGPLSLGIRYESLEDKQAEPSSALPISYKFSLDRVSLLSNIRVFDSWIFVTLVGTLGVSHNQNYEVENSIVIDTLVATKISSRSYGVELGLKMKYFLFGFELGNSSITLQQFNNTINGSVDFSGAYIKTFMGVAF
jgi:hypothetical protein